MRISGWSSDVCSSDLAVVLLAADVHGVVERLHRIGVGSVGQAAEHARHGQADVARILRCAERLPLGVFDGVEDLGQVARTGQFGEVVEARSEEHTSELQSLMRISYAVFCLKKKNTKQKLTLRHNITNKRASCMNTIK